jgi:ferric-dicitrate binding protein FerR (iron transport regulator)
MHTLETPRAGQFIVQLPDGTKVWLNNASSLRYPTSFKGAYREVELLNGEAYFEVAKVPSKPFQVKVVNKLAVDVLGTSFTITAYKEEKKISTTLLTGKVRIAEGVTNQSLNPGEALNIKEGRDWEVETNADTKGAIAWRNGYFHFDNEDLSGVGQQLSRWYDVEVETQTQQAQTFNEEINRNQPLSQVLKAMGLQGSFKGNKLIIEDIPHNH